MVLFSFFFFARQQHYQSTAKTTADSLTSICNCYKKTTLIETNCSTKSDCILCNPQAAVLQHLLTQLKLQFSKNLRRSSILLIIVAMNQLGYNLDVVRGSKQDLASPSMMICYQFSLRTSWITQSTAAASACSGEHHSWSLFSKNKIK